MKTYQIFCFKCGKDFTRNNRLFVFLSCKEIICYNCCNLRDTDKVQLTFNICPNCGIEKVKATDLSKNINKEVQKMILGPKKLVEFISIKQIVKNLTFKHEQLKAIKGICQEMKNKVNDAAQINNNLKKKFLEEKLNTKLIYKNERIMKMMLITLLGQNKELKNKYRSKNR